MFKTIMPLSLIISFRFLGLFIVLPVISVYALSLPGATPAIVGIVIGGYALTQMIFQIPFGIMSDKLGRKGTIITGLLLFAIGSILCAISTDILTLMLGRFLQGAGAIGAVVTATISDVVKEEQRPKAMAMMGGSIAASFALAMVLGPIIGGYAGISTLFWITTFLALASIYIVVTKVPEAPEVIHTYHNVSKFAFLKSSELMKMNITNLLQKGLMTFAFMIIPIILVKSYGWQIQELWKIYIPAMVAGIVAMGPAAVLAEKKGKFKTILLIGIAFFGLSYFILGHMSTETFFLAGIIVFFVGFNMHEPIMQSLTTKYAKVHERGKVLGVFNSFGYAGTFLGGLIGGVYFKDIGGDFTQSLLTISTVIVIICVAWFILIVTLPNPQRKRNIYKALDDINKDYLSKLDTANGIDEWYINDTEKIVVIKYDDTIITEDNIINSIK